MKYKTRKDIKNPNPIVQVCLHRGVEDILKYINSNDEDINEPEAFGSELMKEGVIKLVKAVKENQRVFIIVDCDVDGFSSAAILLNYLYDIFPAWINNCVTWGFHEGKSHGLPEFIDRLEEEKYGLVICPDSSSNDLEEIERLYKVGTEVLILDHHKIDEKLGGKSPYAITINSQYDYPNKFLSGAGVVWQFCRFIDKQLGFNYADNYLDLVAYGLQSDMEDIRAIETKTLIFKGLQSKNIKNPFIYDMIEKHNFSLNKSDYKPSNNNNLQITPIGMSFFLTPFGNAICRSGTMEEKELIFLSMLKFKAFDKIPSTKRGCAGEYETVVEQAVRVCTNVKNRQEREATAALELIEDKIKNDNLLDNKILLVLIEEGKIAPGIAGLVANKLMGKYQRPSCVLTRVNDEGTWYYRGSARGYNKTGLESFMTVCEAAPQTEWCRGHDNAFGLSIPADSINDFIDFTNDYLKDLSTEIVYYVDYIWKDAPCEDIGDTVLAIAEMNDYIGTEFDRPLVCLEGVRVSENNMKIMKSNTLKFTTSAGVDIIKFGGTDEEIEKFSTRTVTINAVCKCSINEWNWQVNPQLQMVDYEIIEETYDWRL